ncbi:MAG: NAD(P)-binding domain-containing protein [Pseudomonadota bacterium]
MKVRNVTAVVVGAGQAGLAVSRELSRRNIDHLVLEKGTVGHAWRTARWDSLRLLTPNWANGLPGARYRGPDPLGFMAARAFVDTLDAYAERISAPLELETEVLEVRRTEPGFRLMTNRGPLGCRALVVATGGCAEASVPGFASGLPGQIVQTTPSRYKRPSDLPAGGVLVVGASASGVQIARELQASGRPVTLSVGSHLRLPRRYRGCDIEWWLDALGILDETLEEVDDIARVRRTPSPQIIGGPHPVDLAALQDSGIEIVGRLAAIRDDMALFSGALAHVCKAADLKLARLLQRIDDWAAGHAPEALGTVADRPDPTPIPAAPRLSLDLSSGEIASIVWATGYRPDHAWLSGLPIFDRRGRLAHNGGVVRGVPGLYALGLPFLRRRRSPQISGAGPDAYDIAADLEALLRHSPGPALAPLAPPVRSARPAHFRRVL